MAAYTDEVAVENYLLTDIEASFSTQITEWIAAVSAYIEQYTGRVFAADESGDGEVRLFEGSIAQKLLIDDCLGVSKVEIGDRYGDSFEEVDAADYQLLPLNKFPKTAIGLKNRAWGVGIHRITGIWGYSETCPADIKFAATVLVAGIINTQLDPTKKSETIGNYSVSFFDNKGLADFEHAKATLDSYRRLTI